MATDKKKPVSKGRKPVAKEKVSSNRKLVNYLVNQIKEGDKLPWRTPYINQYGRNYITGRVYNGFNYIITTFMGSGEYITMNQLKEYNEKNSTYFFVKKGSKGKPLAVYNNQSKKITEAEKQALIREGKQSSIQETDGQAYKKVFYLGIVYVYDVNDIADVKTGASLPRKKDSVRRLTDISSNELGERLINSYIEKSNVKIKENYRSIRGIVASYSPKEDRLNIPPRENFTNDTEYYSTVFHEIVHSTGHSSRLNRGVDNEDSDFRMSSKGYSNEEVIAEFASALLMQELGMSSEDNTKNTSSYINGFCNWLINNPDDLISCVKKAEEAVKYILEMADLEYKKVVEESVEEADTELNEEEFKEKINKEITENTVIKEASLDFKSKEVLALFNTELQKTAKTSPEKLQKRLDRIYGNPIIFKFLGDLGVGVNTELSRNNLKVPAFTLTNRTGNKNADTRLLFTTSFGILIYKDKAKVIYNLERNGMSIKEAMEICKNIGFPKMSVILPIFNLRGKKLTEDESLKIYLSVFRAKFTSSQLHLLETDKEKFIKTHVLVK